MPFTHEVRMALTTVAASVLLAGAAKAQGAAPNLTGTWRFSVTTDAGTGTTTVAFKQQGDTLSGLYSSQVFGEQQIRGTVKDREFSFEFTATIQGTTLTVTYRGTIASADSLHGQVSLGDMGSGSFTASRQAAGGGATAPGLPGEASALQALRSSRTHGVSGSERNAPDIVMVSVASTFQAHGAGERPGRWIA
jgi:hypothetical protein